MFDDREGPETIRFMDFAPNNRKPDQLVAAIQRPMIPQILRGSVTRLVYRLAYNDDIVAFKMGRRQDARRAHI